VHALTSVVAAALERLGHEIVNKQFFDTLTVGLGGAAGEIIHEEALRQRINLRRIYGDYVGITFDESTTFEDVVDLLNVFLAVGKQGHGRTAGRGRRSPYTHASVAALAKELGLEKKVLDEGAMPSKAIPDALRRTSKYLQQPVFNSYKNETDMLRYSTSTLPERDASC
jgi:glycine dehydrogenase